MYFFANCKIYEFNTLCVYRESTVLWPDEFAAYSRICDARRIMYWKQYHILNWEKDDWMIQGNLNQNNIGCFPRSHRFVSSSSFVCARPASGLTLDYKCWHAHTHTRTQMCKSNIAPTMGNITGTPRGAETLMKTGRKASTRRLNLRRNNCSVIMRREFVLQCMSVSLLE